MPKYGLLIDYELCVGCRVCEISCKQEYNRREEDYGIKVQEIESGTLDGKFYYYPFPTESCKLCGKRIAKDLQPACVANCWARVMTFGTIDELAQLIKKKKKTVLWVPH